MPDLVRNKVTGKVGVVGVDPYGIAGPGEIIVSFENARDPNPLLGNGYPRDDWEPVDADDVSPYYREKYGARTRAQHEAEMRELSAQAMRTHRLMQQYEY